jgi:nucleotide-binding universal stress UspA family protein
MTIHDILVGIDASAAGERLLRSALGLARDHKAYLAAAYCMAEDHGVALLARAPVNPSPGIFVAPEVLTAPGDPAADPFPQISHEAQIADRVQHLFCNELQREGLDGEWHLLPSNTTGFLDLAKSFDLTILGQLSPEGRSSGFRRAKPWLQAAGRFWSSLMPTRSIALAGGLLSPGMAPARWCGRCMACCRCSIGPKL